MNLKYKQPVEVSCQHTVSMVMCCCGDVFRASGTPSSVDRRFKKWEARHADCSTKRREGRKVFWLSFCDVERPTGQQFLGACLIEVTAAEADEAAIYVALQFPCAQPDAEWVGAAIKKSHRLGCNPGGEVAFFELPADHPNLSRYRLGTLMDRDTIERIDQELAASDHA